MNGLIISNTNENPSQKDSTIIEVSISIIQTLTPNFVSIIQKYVIKIVIIFDFIIPYLYKEINTFYKFARLYTIFPFLRAFSTNLAAPPKLRVM